jgi:hypothetical protein
MSRPRHPDKHIERAVQYAERLGWRVVLSNGHAWGRLFCPLNSREGCIVVVYSTPRVPENHARHVQREIDLCPHCQEQKPNLTQGDENEPEAV